MKKHDEGYVLPLVLVVMIIMALIAVGVMSVSLHNLQTQKAYIAKMQDQYAAQGEVEKIFTKIEKSVSDLPEKLNGVTSTSVKGMQDVIEQYIEASVSGTEVEWKNEDARACTVNVCVTRKGVAIFCSWRLIDIVLNVEGDPNTYKGGIPEITYEAYEISTVVDAIPDPSEGGDGNA